MTFTLQVDEVVADVRFEADMPSTTRPTSAQIVTALNLAWRRVYKHMVDAGPPETFATETTAASTTAGTIAVALPSTLYRLLGVRAADGTKRRDIQPVCEGRLGAYDAPTGAFSYTLYYVPTPPVLAAAGSFDAVLITAGELLTVLTAERLLDRDRRDTSALKMRLPGLWAELDEEARKRGSQGPREIQDVEDDGAPFVGMPSIDGWRLRAGYVDLYSFSLGG